MAVFAGRDDRGGGIDAAEDFIGGRAVGGVRDVEEEGEGEGGAGVVFEGDGILIEGHFEGWVEIESSRSTRAKHRGSTREKDGERINSFSTRLEDDLVVFMGPNPLAEYVAVF